MAVLELRGGGVDQRSPGLRGLLGAVARRTAVEVSTDAPAIVKPRDAALFEHPLTFLAGSVAFDPLTDGELDALRSFLTQGGMIVVDDTSGVADSEFSRRARSELSRVLGGREWTKLPADHAIFRTFYLLDRAWGRRDASPDVWALVVGGRAAVVLSPNDAMGAWQRDELGNWVNDVSPGGTRQREMALRFGVNLVLYALTLDYKEDLVHLPLILDRKR